MAKVEFVNVEKHFGQTRAVAGVSQVIEDGEFFSLLGPSGCGKTTTLRMTAGFEVPSSGRILIGSDDMTQVPPHKRDTGMVFQHYALFPHRTVFDNVAFGLRVRKTDPAEIRKRVTEVLELVGMSGLEQRYPSQLSGGQQQRVALARAVILRPRVLLLDEPLGALDKKLREQMQFELRRLQRQVGITAIYVTHDQEEALTMSDRVAVMQGGKIVQVASPEEIYRWPATRFVADFIGTSNFLTGSLEELTDREAVFKSETGLMVRATPGQTLDRSRVASISIRPENLRLYQQEPDELNRVPGRIIGLKFLGDAVMLEVHTRGDEVLMVKQAAGRSEPGTTVGTDVWVAWDMKDCLALNDD